MPVIDSVAARAVAFLILVLTALPLATSSRAQTAIIDANLISAVVKISTKVPGDARTARNLGTEREGSGVVIDGNGLVLTVGYVMLEAASAEIGLAGGRTVPASLVANDHDTGFGLLRAAAPLGVKPMELGSSKGLAERDQVLVASFGSKSSLMGAYVVSRRPFAGWWEYLLERAIYTSPPHLQFGGAALIGGDGKLLGIGSLIVGDAAGPGNPVPGNMFIPIDYLKPILADLLEQGHAAGKPRPWLGLSSEEVRGRLFVRRVAKGGPAHQAGIRPGDLVIGVDGKPVSGLADFYRKVWATGKAGVAVPVNVLQGINAKPVVIKSSSRYDWLKLKRSY